MSEENKIFFNFQRMIFLIFFYFSEDIFFYLFEDKFEHGRRGLFKSDGKEQRFWGGLSGE